MYSAEVKYTLISKSGEKTEESKECFGFLSRATQYNEYFHIRFALMVHKDCGPFREQWINLLREFDEFKGIEYSYDFENDVFDFKAENVITKISLWFLTFVRYLQEFPEIVVDFCGKNLTVENGFSEFFMSHLVTCKFYSYGICGHGLAIVTKNKNPSFEKYKQILHKSLETQDLKSIQSLYSQCCELPVKNV